MYQVAKHQINNENPSPNLPLSKLSNPLLHVKFQEETSKYYANQVVSMPNTDQSMMIFIQLTTQKTAASTMITFIK